MTVNQKRGNVKNFKLHRLSPAQSALVTLMWKMWTFSGLWVFFNVRRWFEVSVSVLTSGHPDYSYCSPAAVICITPSIFTLQKARVTSARDQMLNARWNAANQQGGTI